MKRFFQGVSYNLKGLTFGLKHPALLMLGLARFLILVVITVVAGVVILAKFQEILNLMWNKPESMWIVWLWYLVSWLLALLLMAISAVAAYILSQILFAVLIMDYMSQVTERKVTGRIQAATSMPFFKYYIYLIKQEIPRSGVPVLISLLLLILGWFTPLGPLLTILTPLAAILFLAWDNTDLVPARRMVPFSQRFAFMRRHLLFHLGFGILFLVPVLNMVLLSFAPVGATLYHVEQHDSVAAGGETAA